MQVCGSALALEKANNHKHLYYNLSLLTLACMQRHGNTNGGRIT